MRKKTKEISPFADAERVAANGLLHRRLFLGGGALFAGAAALGGLGAARPASAQGAFPDWRLKPGKSFTGYGVPSRFEDTVLRTFTARAPSYPSPGAGSSRTPLHMLEGIITPSGLHFERSHSGVPDIDPERHTLLVHGLVRQPLLFDVEALARYPTVSRIHFIECSGNSGAGWGANPPVGPVGTMHGLLSCSEWSGVPLAYLLDEAGVDPAAKWILAEGIDAAGMSRSVPLSKCLDDALVALYQNGERVRPEQGYPMRLLLPGWEGNMNVKWLSRIKLTAGPTHTKDETSKYTELMPDGKSLQFTFPMQVKSTITRPSEGVNMRGPGFYEISGFAWSGNGKIRRVDVSADGGNSWAEAALSEPVLSHALTRFRMPWQWDGSEVVLQSRAVDEAGNVQPTRDALIAEKGIKNAYHYNGITSWEVRVSGLVKNVWA
jgi:sulfane dehydrogenase subunit SoxC